MNPFEVLGSIALPVAGGIGGFLLGGPVGAIAGAGIGSSISSGINSVTAQEAANKYNKQAIQDTNATNLAIARENNEMQEKYYLKQFEQNRQFFDDSMTYNSASAQVNRLREAGLNPALAMYQGVNSGTVSASSAPAPPARQQAVMQAPLISPVDYSPISSGILNSVSLLKELAPAVESLYGAKDSAKRAGAETKTRVAASNAAESGAKAAETAAGILNENLKVAQYESTVAQFKHTALATLGIEKGQKLTKLFNDAFIADLQSKVAGKNLTEAQIANVVKDTALKALEEQKQTLSKSGYSEMLQLINSIDNSFFKSLAKIVATIAMIGK